MKKLSIALFALVFLAFQVTAQSSKTYNLEDFSGISVSNSADVIFTQGPKAVSVSGPQDLIDKLEVEVKKGSLSIGNQKGKSSNWSGREGLTFKISSPNLSVLLISGSCDFTLASDLKTDNLSVIISGSGDIVSKGKLTADKVSIVIGGSGDVGFSGSCQKQSLAISGSGDVENNGLKCKEASIVNSGNGDIEVYVSEKISVVNSGNGDVEVKGNPNKKSIVNTGSGDIDYK